MCLILLDSPKTDYTDRYSTSRYIPYYTDGYSTSRYILPCSYVIFPTSEFSTRAVRAYTVRTWAVRALGVSVRQPVRGSRRPLSANTVRGSRRPSSPEAVRPYFRSRAIRQALIRAPCFGPPSVRRAVSPRQHPSRPYLIAANRPPCSLSIPSSDRAPHSTHPEASTSPLYAVLVYHTTTTRNAPYF